MIRKYYGVGCAFILQNHRIQLRINQNIMHPSYLSILQNTIWHSVQNIALKHFENDAKLHCLILAVDKE